MEDAVTKFKKELAGNCLTEATLADLSRLLAQQSTDEKARPADDDDSSEADGDERHLGMCQLDFKWPGPTGDASEAASEKISSVCK
jgi:hypothetical protein